METLGILVGATSRRPRQREGPGGATLGPGTGVSVALGDGETMGVAWPDVGEVVGKGFWRQIGMAGLMVAGADGAATRGDGDGRGGTVGSGWGGTRGSGKPGSGAAASDCERFQFGPNGPFVWLGAGVMTTLGKPPKRRSVADPKTRSPMPSPMAMASSSTAVPSTRTRVMKRFEGSSMGQPGFGTVQTVSS
jgi:hypothetical protein